MKKKSHPLRIITNFNCNAFCPFCHKEGCEQCTPNIIDANYLIYVIKKIKSINICSIALTGGEPLLHPDIDKILAYLSMFDVPVHLVTNGILLNRHIDSILKYKNIDIHISIHTLLHCKTKLIYRIDYPLSDVLNMLDKINLSKKVVNIVIAKHINDYIPDIIRMIYYFIGKVKLVQIYTDIKEGQGYANKILSLIKNILLKDFTINYYGRKTVFYLNNYCVIFYSSCTPENYYNDYCEDDPYAYFLLPNFTFKRMYSNKNYNIF